MVSGPSGDESEIMSGDLSDFIPISPFLVDRIFRMGTPISPLRCKGGLDSKRNPYEEGRFLSLDFSGVIEASGRELSPTIWEMIPNLGEILLSAKPHSPDINTNVDSVILDGGDSLYHKENVKNKGDNYIAKDNLISKRFSQNVHPPMPRTCSEQLRDSDYIHYPTTTARHLHL